MARGIAHVTLVGNLTRDPELRQTPSGTSVCQLGVAVELLVQGRIRPVGRKAELLRRGGLGRAGRELRPVPGQGPPGSRRRPSRPAQLGSAGRYASAARSRSSPTR